MANVETTLTVGTNKRVYYLRLIATQREHIARIAFTYPEEEERRQERNGTGGEGEGRRSRTPGSARTKQRDEELEVLGRDARQGCTLHAAGERGRRRYAHRNSTLLNKSASSACRRLRLPGKAGPNPANSHWEENKLILDALFDRVCLLQGVGKSQQRVCIHNDAERRRNRWQLPTQSTWRGVSRSGQCDEQRHRVGRLVRWRVAPGRGHYRFSHSHFEKAASGGNDGHPNDRERCVT